MSNTTKPMDGVETQPQQIDDALYSKQLYVLSHEAMQKITSTSVLVVGLTGLGIEIVKDIVLAGVKSVTLYDDEIVKIEDLSSQFYFSDDQVGKLKRSDACIKKVVDLNSYVRISSHTGELTEDYLKQFQVIVLANQTLETQKRLNEIAHKNGIYFISAETRGLFAAIFNDFGENFKVVDTNGENPLSYMISTVSQEDEGIVYVTDEQKVQLQDGDFVTFKEVNGMTELNDLPPQKIKVISPYTFSICTNTTAFKPYTSGGYVTEVKQPKTLTFKSLNETLEKGEGLFYTDDSKFTHPQQLLIGFQSIHEFQAKHKSFPRPHNSDDAKEVLETAKVLAKKYQIEEVEDKLLTQLSYNAQGDTVAMQAVIGGCTAQEVLKAASGKFHPINQLAYFDFVEALPTEDLPESEFQPIGSRYDGQIKIFGKTIQNKIENLNYFLVGSGAIGCEMLKNFSMMGLGCGQKGLVHVTDMDTIEKSNLNRQFLFRPHDIQQLKSTTAANAVKVMNPSLNIKSYSLRVGLESENFYNETFFQSLDGICNALDNVEARLYMDGMAVFHRKPLLESGTLGTKGNTQVVVPNLTESYSSSRDPPEKTIPMCILHNFPNAIEHTIQWARDTFEGIFKNSADSVNSYLTNPAFLQSLNSQNSTVRLETLNTIKAYLVDKPLNFQQCIQWARLKFEEYYNNNIEQLLYNFPKDMMTNNGIPFWSGPKRAPTPIKFDINNALHYDFVVAAANLRAYNYGLKAENNPELIKKTATDIIVPDFTPKKVKIHTTEREEINAKQQQQQQQQSNLNENAEDEECDKVLSLLPTPSSMAGYKINSISFEKDDDTNHHIDFITAASNLRATNYAITVADKHKTKGIAGKIIPALVTTTAMVSGLISLELFKIHQNKPLDQYRSAFMNLAIPFFGFIEPIAAPKNKVRDDWSWTLWDRFDVQGELTLQEFLSLFEKKYKLEISMLSCHVTLLYSSFIDKKTRDQRLPMKLSELYELLSKKPLPKDKRHLVFEICCQDTETEDDVDVPFIKYTF
ncbi:ubiquitin activating enzyme E1 [Tieghemostelium lacteum]|uniref:E1 ubiquitin-activating enzyme n=1 Tax=Tieghemostelium lacteum TaxID=361077 RepID=A0A151ZJG8_TIELA|nr:ubiquitin activating enzyme E1 [Tieghemostelium lacteum]|eukprot:KYQ94030.1 ubiquitin activating enzyme E1 [Tieghemostelium lacteum]